MQGFTRTFLFSLCLLLAACKHGFEGQYRAEIGSKIGEQPLLESLNAGEGKAWLEQMQNLANGVLGMSGSTHWVIGEDYLDVNGKRTSFKKIFVRKSGDKRYLVFQRDDKKEEIWEIIDDNTLKNRNDFITLTLRRSGDL